MIADTAPLQLLWLGPRMVSSLVLKSPKEKEVSCDHRLYLTYGGISLNTSLV